MRNTLLLITVAASLTLSGAVWAQGFRDRGSDRGGSGYDRGGSDRDRGGGSGYDRGGYDRDRGGYDRDRGGFDPKQMIEGLDANRNGVIDPNELNERSARFLQRAAEKAGLKSGEPWPVDRLVSAASDRGDSRRDDNNSGSSNSSSGSSRPGEPSRSEPPKSSAAPLKSLVPGFTEKDGVKVPGFDVPLAGTPAKPAKQYDEKTVARVDDLLREADTNRNGSLDKDEIQAYRNWASPPEESDTDKDGRLSRAELLERIAKRYGGSSRSSSSGSPSSGGSSSPGNNSGDQAAQMRQYAEGLLRRYDDNKSGYLEKDEWRDMKTEYHSADVNKDNVISLDELVARLIAMNSGQAGASSAGGGGGPGPGGPPGPGGYGSGGGGSGRYGGSRDGKGERDKYGKPIDKKPVVRALTPTERLPKGLPDWFLRNDADGDGQVGMVEYAAAWSDTTATEFQKYDTNGDGFITAVECLAVDKDSKKK